MVKVVMLRGRDLNALEWNDVDKRRALRRVEALCHLHKCSYSEDNEGFVVDATAYYSKARVYWHGKIGETDDFGGAITDTFIDGAVRGMGSWAIMNPANHAKFGRGLGTGLGQRYEKQPDGKWLKTGG